MWSLFSSPFSPRVLPPPTLSWHELTVRDWYWGWLDGPAGSMSQRAACRVVSKREESERAKGVPAGGFLEKQKVPSHMSAVAGLRVSWYLLPADVSRETVGG